jgi:hypothetical protein
MTRPQMIPAAIPEITYETELWHTSGSRSWECEPTENRTTARFRSFQDIIRNSFCKIEELKGSQNRRLFLIIGSPFANKDESQESDFIDSMIIHLTPKRVSLIDVEIVNREKGRLENVDAKILE